MRLALLIFVYGCEFFTIVMQTWLFLDIDFHTIHTDFKIHLEHNFILLFGLSMFGSLLNIFYTSVPLNCISNLQIMVDAQNEKERRHDEELKAQEEEMNKKNKMLEDDEEQQRQAHEEYVRMQ